MKTTLSISLVLVLVGATAAADRTAPEGEDHLTPEELALVFEQFRHEAHVDTFTEEQIGCLACHQLGGVLGGDLSAEVGLDIFLTPPSAGCHYCHNPPEEQEREPIGPGGCQICHGAGYKPDSHGPAWLDYHGTEVRMIRPGCHECHDTGQCISCHENRGALSRSTHPPGWGAVHGIEARFDPQACISCHAGDSCVQCHEGGRSPW